MTFLRKYGLIQATLLFIALVGFGTALYNTVNANSSTANNLAGESAEVAEATASGDLVVISQNIPNLDLLDEEGSEDGPSEREDDTSELGEDDVLEQVAQVLGVEIETLEEALSNGLTLADVAQENGVDLQLIIDVFVAAEEKAIAEELAAGEITEDEAVEILQEITDLVAFEISTPYKDPLVVVMETIGLDEEAFWEALDSGQTIEAIAAAAGVDLQTVIDAVVQAETEYVDAMVAAGIIDEAEKEEWLGELTSEVTDVIRNPLESDQDGPSEGSDRDSAEREDGDEDCDHSEEVDASEEDE